ncbi:MAG: hypothetical protein QM703_15605 [Gemmatales bacterium]
MRTAEESHQDAADDAGDDAGEKLFFPAEASATPRQSGNATRKTEMLAVRSLTQVAEFGFA